MTWRFDHHSIEENLLDVDMLTPGTWAHADVIGGPGAHTFHIAKTILSLSQTSGHSRNFDKAVACIFCICVCFKSE